MRGNSGTCDCRRESHLAGLAPTVGHRRPLPPFPFSSKSPALAGSSRESAFCLGSSCRQPRKRPSNYRRLAFPQTIASYSSCSQLMGISGYSGMHLLTSDSVT